jgi:hypothetical protein
MKKYSLLFLPLIFTVPAQAKWIAVDTVATPGVIHYFNAETLQNNNNIGKIWILSSYDDKQKGGYHSIKSLYEIDCLHRTARLFTMLLYPDKKASDTVIGAHHEESPQWFNFSSHSVFQSLFNKVICVN